MFVCVCERKKVTKGLLSIATETREWVEGLCACVHESERDGRREREEKESAHGEREKVRARAKEIKPESERRRERKSQKEEKREREKVSQGVSPNWTHCAFQKLIRQF